MKPQSPPLPGYPVEEFTLGHGSKDVPAHPVVRWDEHTFLSRHRLSDEELAEVTRTREVFVFHGGIEGRFLPVRLQVKRPQYRLRVLRVGLAGAGATVCHGLEVSEAGGSERDRVDYAAAEAAGLLASRASLPAHVALLQADSEWMLKGGQTCATRGELEAALTLRLKKALDLPGKRVEAHGADGSVLKVTVEEMTPEACVEAAAAA